MRRSWWHWAVSAGKPQGVCQCPLGYNHETQTADSWLVSLTAKDES